MTSTYTVRRAFVDDLTAISKLIISPSIKWFGNKRPKFEAKENLFKNYQTHRLVVEYNNVDDIKLIAYAEFRNYPAIGPLPSDCWLDWLNERYCVTLPISWLNTLFFNFCVYNGRYPECVLVILRELFYIENRVLYLITVRTPTLSSDVRYIECFDELDKYAKVFYPREFSIGSNSNTQSIYITDRIQLLPKITYRKALAEDNDDIIEMHVCEYPELRDELGDYYIAEELLRQDEDAKNTTLIVAEVENEQQETSSAGFMWLTGDVDIKFHVKNYELAVFGNLIKAPNLSQKTYQEYIAVLSVEPKNKGDLFTAAAIDELDESTVIGGVQRNDSSISVASLGKVTVSSFHGTIIDLHNATKHDKFYMREGLYLKFQYMFEKLAYANHYVMQETKVINLTYNQDKNTQNGLQKASNVFALKYICAHRDFPLERLYNFLAAMFSVYPDRDYCIMTIPKSVKALPSHMEALKYFMPVAQRPSEESNLTEIYIAHRSTMFGEISLYRLTSHDFHMIQSMVVDSKLKYVVPKSPASSIVVGIKVIMSDDKDMELMVVSIIMNDILENDSSEFDMFTIRCGNSTKSAKDNTPIGYVILREFKHHKELYHHHHLPKNDEYLNNQRAQIISLRIHPLFSNCSDVLFRYLAAKTNYLDFYFISKCEQNAFSNDLKTMMMLLEPNPMMKYMAPVSTPQSDSDSRIHYLPTYDYREDRLIVFRHRLNPAKWFGNSNRLVIIGFSAMTKAFLRQLIFLWNSRDHRNAEIYTCLPRLQVTCIAEPGVVEAEFECMFECAYCENTRECYMCYSNNSCYVRDAISRMNLRNWVHFISGYVNYVDRENKFIKINKSCQINYDTLLLMNYKSFNLTAENLRDAEHRSPANFIEVNDRLDRFKLYYKLRVLLEEYKRHHSVLIYGSNLQTYECINFLITHGISPSRLHFIKPYMKIVSEEQQKLSNPYYDQNLQYILDDMLTDLGVELHIDLNFSGFVKHKDGNFIIEVAFEQYPSKKEITFDCDVFISFAEGYMTQRVKGWLELSGIKLYKKYRILVDKDFRTNDPDIYAVGSFIKITNAINHQYKYVNERETAMKLIHILGLRTPERPFEYKYSMPTYFQAALPLGYYICKVTMPRRYLASHLLSCSKCNMSTYHEGTFCRIGLTAKLFVDEIVAVAKTGTNFDYLEYFCGKHETMLNNMRARYDAGAITCFMTFLQEPWTELLTHDEFETLQTENHQILKPMIETFQMYKSQTDLHFREMNQQFLEQNLLNFVRKHRGEFQHQFALPEDYLGVEYFANNEN